MASSATGSAAAGFTPYTYIQCPCFDSTTTATTSSRPSDGTTKALQKLGSDEEDDERTFDPRAPRSNYSLYPLSYLLYCEDCHQIRCPRCAFEEIVTFYCPSCLFEVPSSSIRGEGNRCTRNCFLCPVCQGPTVVTSADPTPPSGPDPNLLSADNAASGNGGSHAAHHQSGPFVLACSYCTWTSAEAGLQFDRASGVYAQLARMRTRPAGGQQGAPAGEHHQRQETKTGLGNIEEEAEEGEVAVKKATPQAKDGTSLEPDIRFAMLKAFYQSQISSMQGLGATTASMLGDLGFSSPNSLSRLMSLYTGSGSGHRGSLFGGVGATGNRGRVAVMREATTADEGLHVLLPEGTLEDDERRDIARLRDEGWAGTASRDQRHVQTCVVGGTATTTLSGLTSGVASGGGSAAAGIALGGGGAAGIPSITASPASSSVLSGLSGGSGGGASTIGASSTAVIGTPTGGGGRFVSDLRPIPALLRTKRSKRCPVCRHIMSKPETKVSATRFRIRLVAANYIPTMTVRPLNPPAVTPAAPQPASSRHTATSAPQQPQQPLLTPLVPYQFLLTIKNPLFDRIRVSLATPSVTPGRFPSRVTLLCPQFDVDANADMWDEALTSASASEKRRSKHGDLAAAGEAGSARQQTEAGKVWERGRNWVSVVVEVVPASLRRPVEAYGGSGSGGSGGKHSLSPSTPQLAMPGNYSSTPERSPLPPVKLNEDEDILEIPLFVRVEWEADPAHDDPMGKDSHRDRDRDGRASAASAKEKRELAYWCVIGVGRISRE